MKIGLTSSVLAGKIAYLASRARGFGGTSLPGAVARRLYPNCLRDLAGQVPGGVVLVSGTNGKTTTTNMLAGILRVAGRRVAVNSEGANLISGVTACLVLRSGAGGSVNCDCAVLEVDEATLPAVLGEVSPRLLVLTNFSRDQLDRYGEVDSLVVALKAALAGREDVQLVLNADDPLVAHLGVIPCSSRPPFYYGLAQERLCALHRVLRAALCPVCNAPLDYGAFYRCLSCSFARPTPQVEGFLVPAGGGKAACQISYAGNCVRLELKTGGQYNLYNALAAVSAGVLLGVPLAVAAGAVESFSPVAGRMERFSVGGREVLLALVKNPAGFNEILRTFSGRPAVKRVMLVALNDNVADGRDVSWLWDVDWEEFLAVSGWEGIAVCTGGRAEEAALRLKYAGLPPGRLVVEPCPKKAVGAALQFEAGDYWFFVTYTALKVVRQQLMRVLGR